MLSSRRDEKTRTQTDSPGLWSRRIRTRVVRAIALVLIVLIAVVARPSAADHERVERYHVIELSLSGPHCRPTDGPARDVHLGVAFRQESGSPTIRVAAFFDGDGHGAGLRVDRRWVGLHHAARQAGHVLGKPHRSENEDLP